MRYPLGLRLDDDLPPELGTLLMASAHGGERA